MQKGIIKKYKENGLVVPGVYDKVFKIIMQDKECRDYLIEIIYELTRIPKNYIKENIVIRNSELPLECLEEKQKITDLVIEIKDSIINLEMNNFYYKGLIKRNDIYLNELRKLHIGQKYIHIPKIIQINFDNFNKFKGKTIRKFMILDVETHEKETENYEKYHINLQLIKEKYYNKEKLTRLEKMVLLLVLDKIDELKEVSGEDEIMKRVEEKITKLSKDAAMILCYDEDEYKEKVRQLVTQTEIEEAVETAKAEAVRQGLETGIKEGIKEGKKDIVLKLIKEKVDINIVSSVSGLSIDEISKLQNEK